MDLKLTIAYKDINGNYKTIFEHFMEMTGKYKIKFMPCGREIKDGIKAFFKGNKEK